MGGPMEKMKAIGFVWFKFK